MKIKEYMTVSDGHSDIIERVNDFINEGWQPIGGISVADNMPYPCKQAMVKYEEEAKPQYYGFGTPPENIATSHPDIFKPKERKVVDCFYIDAFSMTNAEYVEKSKLILEQGW